MIIYRRQTQETNLWHEGKKWSNTRITPWGQTINEQPSLEPALSPMSLVTAVRQIRSALFTEQQRWWRVGVACVYETWSMCTIQVHSFWCYYYTSETLAKKSSKAQSREAHRRVRAGLEGGRGKGEEQQEGKERLQYGWGGCGSEDSQAVEQVKAKTSDDSPIRMLPKTDLANQSLILRSSLEGATFFLSCEYPAHHYWHGFNFFFFV